MRSLRVVVGVAVVAVLLVALGFLLGHRNRDGIALFGDLDEGLGVALGVPAAEVARQPGYRRVEYAGCASGTCRQVGVSGAHFPDDHGQLMERRLYEAGWTLIPAQHPECLSDVPEVQGWICTYERRGADDGVSVSIEVEQPPSFREEWWVLASTG